MRNGIEKVRIFRRSHVMVLTAIALGFFASNSGSVSFPALVDKPLADYYNQALKASKNGEYQRAMAMLKLLLIPENTPVYPDYSSLPANVRQEFHQGVLQGFQMWRDVLGQEFPFVLDVNNPDAPVKIVFVSAISGESPACKGEIRVVRKIQWNSKVHYVDFSAKISLAMHSRENQWMTSGEVAHILAHEFGHALGLGHPQGVGTIMGPVVIGNPTRQVSSSELATVMHFRNLVKQDISQIQNASTQKSQPVKVNTYTFHSCSDTPHNCQ